MSTIRVLVLGDVSSPHLEAVKNLGEGVTVDVGMDDEFVREKAPEAEVILSALFSGEPFKLAMQHARAVKWTHTLSAGVEHLLTPEFVASPAPLTNARGVYKKSLAEFALLGVLYFAKEVPTMRRNQMAGKWEKFVSGEAYKGTLGVVGYGEIGQASAKLAHGIGMRVLAVRRRVEKCGTGDGIADAVYPPERMHEMLAQCDYVVVAAPGTPQTRGMMSDAEFAAMKQGSVVINVGRGTVIDEKALIRTLQSGHLRGAALDVFEKEPLPEGHPFYSMENVLVSPHCADQTADWLDQSVAFFLRNFEHYRKGEPLENVVDKEASY
jgi:phosphoglycerate dehydrogenase-like enzyme